MYNFLFTYCIFNIYINIKKKYVKIIERSRIKTSTTINPSLYIIIRNVSVNINYPYFKFLIIVFSSCSYIRYQFYSVLLLHCFYFFLILFCPCFFMCIFLFYLPFVTSLSFSYWCVDHLDLLESFPISLPTGRRE